MGAIVGLVFGILFLAMAAMFMMIFLGATGAFGAEFPSWFLFPSWFFLVLPTAGIIGAALCFAARKRLKEGDLEGAGRLGIVASVLMMVGNMAAGALALIGTIFVFQVRP